MPENNEEEAPADHGNILAAWDIPEFDHHNRSRGWFIAAAIIGIAVLVYALVTRNFLFAIIVILAAIILYQQSTVAPKDIGFAITEGGLEVGPDFFAFKDIKNFWIHYEPPHGKTIFFTFKSSLRPGLSVPLRDENPVPVRQTLLRYVPEDQERENEPITHAIGRNLKI